MKTWPWITDRKDWVTNRLVLPRYWLRTLFKLTPPLPPKVRWRQKALESFAPPGGLFGSGGLIADENGALYGTTRTGGAYAHGTVFQYTP